MRDALLNKNQEVLDKNVGSANYDIGHLFTKWSDRSGKAVIGSACDNANKAKGGSGFSSNVGDPFDVDIVAHEIGPQLGGKHTFDAVCREPSLPGVAS